MEKTFFEREETKSKEYGSCKAISLHKFYCYAIFIIGISDKTFPITIEITCQLLVLATASKHEDCHHEY